MLVPNTIMIHIVLKLCSLKTVYFFCLFVCFSFFLFGAVPTAYGGSQARGRIETAAASLHHSHSHSHSNAGSKPHLQPVLQLEAMLDSSTH